MTKTLKHTDTEKHQLTLTNSDFISNNSLFILQEKKVTENAWKATLDIGGVGMSKLDGDSEPVEIATPNIKMKMAKFESEESKLSRYFTSGRTGSELEQLQFSSKLRNKSITLCLAVGLNVTVGVCTNIYTVNMLYHSF